MIAMPTQHSRTPLTPAYLRLTLEQIEERSATARGQLEDCGYDSPEALALLDGIVDIYMPDFKLWSPERSGKLLKAEDYPEAARAAIRAMHAQVGPLVTDENGLARRGLLIRHLVMPGCLDETRRILTWIAEELGTDTYVNLMDQYYPAGKVSSVRYPEINRRLGGAEFAEALAIGRELGLRLDQRVA